jgi:hypothetical protein
VPLFSSLYGPSLPGMTYMFALEIQVSTYYQRALHDVYFVLFTLLSCELYKLASKVWGDVSVTG